MYAARLITVILLILAILFAYSPQVREKVGESWVTIRPAVVALMDNFYAAFRSLVAGKDSKNHIETPPPDAPGVNFVRIVTLNDSTLN
jgi:hypothetical protein